MSRKRKYPEVKGYWVYSIQVPSVNKYYIGVSRRKECSQRWIKSKYESMVLAPYLEEWDSMTKTVLVDGLSKEQAYKYEDNIIQALKMNNLCINSNRSGLIADDINAYQREYIKQYRKNNTEFRERNNQRAKQWRLDNPEYHKQYYERKKLEKQQHTSVH